MRENSADLQANKGGGYPFLPIAEVAGGCEVSVADMRSLKNLENNSDRN